MARKIRIPIKVTTRVTGKITYTQRREIHQWFEYEHEPIIVQPTVQPAAISQTATQHIESSIKRIARPSQLPFGLYSPQVEQIYQDLAERSKAETESENKMYDVFVSHASEDKKEFVQPLVEALQDAGIRVWYDALEMEWGKSLRAQIDNGIKRSKYCILVLSKHFFAKKWTNRELDGILAKENVTGATPLPIWYQVGYEDVYEFSPTLSGLFSMSSSDHSISDIVKAFKLILEKEPICSSL